MDNIKGRVNPKALIISVIILAMAILANTFTSFWQTANGDEKVKIQVVNEESQIIEVVKNAAPAVVSIIASAEVPIYENCYRDVNPGLPLDLQDIFNFQIPTRCQTGTQLQRVGAGTGFLVSDDGYIVTNKHVVDDEAGEYTVVLNDEKNFGEKVKAEVLARDPGNDIAILKIEKKDLPHLEFGDSDQISVGQTTIAIGYALGQFDNTVSKGVVSGLSRNIEASTGDGGSEILRSLIQTDAAINPGNSGGPLLDIAGKVIGVNVAKASAQSIGFAIPANVARDDYQQVLRSGTIVEKERAFLGVRYQMVTEAIQSQNNLPYNYGAIILRGNDQSQLAVQPGSPADKAGLVENDIILEINGERVTERVPLYDVIARYAPGDTIQLKYFHDGEEKNVEVTLDKVQ